MSTTDPHLPHHDPEQELENDSELVGDVMLAAQVAEPPAIDHPPAAFRRDKGDGDQPE